MDICPKNVQGWKKKYKVDKSPIIYGYGMDIKQIYLGINGKIFIIFYKNKCHYTCEKKYLFYKIN